MGLSWTLEQMDLWGLRNSQPGLHGKFQASCSQHLGVQGGKILPLRTGWASFILSPPATQPYLCEQEDGEQRYININTAWGRAR